MLPHLKVWNQKELVRRIGTALGGQHPRAKDISWVISRVGPLSQKLEAQVGGLDSWLARFHGTAFVVTAPDGGGEATVALTAEGLEKYAPQYSAARRGSECGGGGEGGSSDPKAGDLASELRGTVFDELQREAIRRRKAGELYATPTLAEGP